jgi:TnsA endonuclease N terminal
MARPKPRKWKPKNPHKYVGNVNEIYTRSSWETMYMNHLDEQDNVILWASEEIKIKYVSPVDLQIHTYYPDFLVRMKTRNGEHKTYLIEIKPNIERFAPLPPKNRNSRKFLERLNTYNVNKAKWEAAEIYCSKQGITFLVLDEYDLGIKQRVKK